jgi:flagellar hook-associated protein 1 FlgK
MRSAFFGIETARRGLFAFQQALDTTGHNISNANTPGYSRQVVRLSETTPFAPPSFNRPSMPGMLGTGVEVSSIDRMRDEFIDTELRNESQSLGRWETRRDLLAEVELIYTEPSDSGIRSALDAMWTSMQNLANHPEDGEARSVVKQTSAAFADTVRHTYDQLNALRKSLDESITVKVDDINRKASQIANLNDQIMKATTAGLNPNDFKDQRELLLKDLSKIVNIGVTEGTRGDVMVTIAGTPLVDLNQARSIEAVPDPLNGNLVNLQWSDTGDPVYVSNGQLQGLFEMRDTVVVDYINQLNKRCTHRKFIW